MHGIVRADTSVTVSLSEFYSSSLLQKYQFRIKNNRKKLDGGKYKIGAGSLSTTVECFRLRFVYLNVLWQFFEIRSKSARLPAKFNIWQTQCPISNAHTFVRILV